MSLDSQDLKENQVDELYPGMPVEAMISLGKRTVIDYFLSPLTSSLDSTFREE